MSMTIPGASGMFDPASFLVGVAIGAILVLLIEHLAERRPMPYSYSPDPPKGRPLGPAPAPLKAGRRTN